MSGRAPSKQYKPGQSQIPLLKDERGRPSSYDAPDRVTQPEFAVRRSTFRSRSPADQKGASATKTKYGYAAVFLILSLISFTVQTETAVHIQRELGWNKAYCMLYLTHGSWSLLWPSMLVFLRIKNWKKPWRVFWRRHVYILSSTAQMVESQHLHLNTRESQKSALPYLLRITAFVALALTIAGASWYVAVDLTSASDLTAIYNCSAFFAYLFSIPLLHDKFRFDKAFSVLVAIAGVMTIAYGDSGHGKQDGGKSGGAIDDGGRTNNNNSNNIREESEARYRTLGNLIIGVGSVLYGLYEVLYKKLACPPEGTSAGRGMIFANAFGSMIGCFTILVLWIPLPILHYTGLEPFEFPQRRAARLLLLSVFSNVVFSGSFLILISLTSPVLSSVAALLTIFIVAIVDWRLKDEPLSTGAIIGGLFIIAAFIMLSFSTYREMDEERQKSLELDVTESDLEEP